MSRLVRIISHTNDSKNGAIHFVVDCDGTCGEASVAGNVLYVREPLCEWAEDIADAIRKLKGAMITEKD